MKVILLLLLTAFLSSCSSKIIHDPRGNKGEEVSMRYLDDKYSCEQLARENTSNIVEGYKVIHNWYIRPSFLFLIDKMEYSYDNLVKECLRGRGHSIL